MVAAMARNRCWFIAVSARNWSSTTKLSSASRMAGSNAVASVMVPQPRSACSQVAAVPGTPTDKPELTTWSNGSLPPVAGSRNASGFIAAGAVSRPSKECTWRVRAS